MEKFDTQKFTSSFYFIFIATYNHMKVYLKQRCWVGSFNKPSEKQRKCRNGNMDEIERNKKKANK